MASDGQPRNVRRRLEDVVTINVFMWLQTMQEFMFVSQIRTHRNPNETWRDLTQRLIRNRMITDLAFISIFREGPEPMTRIWANDFVESGTVEFHLKMEEEDSDLSDAEEREAEEEEENIVGEAIVERVLNGLRRPEVPTQSFVPFTGRSHRLDDVMATDGDNEGI
jgi:hypothetical protein